MGLILAICGSLRANSVNRLVLQSLQKSLPELSISRAVAELPIFNPDLLANRPQAVETLSNEILEATAILVASPEYIHGVSSVVKSALDWTVDTGAWSNKPVFVINCSGRANIAH
ncbi:MAG: NADPH-dependent FMN reductase [Armatimonadota bacterium]